MATDWLRNQNVALLAFVVAAVGCSLVLALTRERWSPTQARARVQRAILIVLFGAVAAYVAAARIGDSGMLAFGPPEGGFFTFKGLRLLCVGTWALFFGLLIPVVLEDRTLGEMGWVRRHVVVYVAVALVAAVAFRLAFHPPSMGAKMLAEMDARFRQPLAYLRLLPPGFIGLCLAEGLLAAFCEENLFRGHLLASLREWGWSGARANHLQALLFAMSHPYLVLFWAGEHRNLLPGVYPALYLFGLLCGFARIRAGSLVPGFVFHAIGNAILLVAMLGMLAAFTAHV